MFFADLDLNSIGHSRQLMSPPGSLSQQPEIAQRQFAGLGQVLCYRRQAANTAGTPPAVGNGAKGAIQGSQLLHKSNGMQAFSNSQYSEDPLVAGVSHVAVTVGRDTHSSSGSEEAQGTLHHRSTDGVRPQAVGRNTPGQVSNIGGHQPAAQPQQSAPKGAATFMPHQNGSGSSTQPAGVASGQSGIQGSQAASAGSSGSSTSSPDNAVLELCSGLPAAKIVGSNPPTQAGLDQTGPSAGDLTLLVLDRDRCLRNGTLQQSS
jgi:hypothetical protein